VLQHAGNLSSYCFPRYFPGKLVRGWGKTWRKAELSGFAYGCCCCCCFCLVVTVCHTISAIRLMPPRGFPPFSQSPSPPEDGLILWQLTGYCRSLLAVSILIELSPSFSTHKGHLLTIIAFSYRSRAQENCQQMSKTNLSINERTRHGKLLWLTINGQVLVNTHTRIRKYVHISEFK